MDELDAMNYDERDTTRYGLIIGKFYPPHEGHHYLINVALSECRHVTVMVLAHPDDDRSLPGIKRAVMIENEHMDAVRDGRLMVYNVLADLPVDYSSREVDMLWARHVVASWRAAVGKDYWPPRLTHVYSSELYGENLAIDLTELVSVWKGDGGIKHRMVDLKRIAKPVSAKKIRENPVANWQNLPESTRAELTKRVVICGAESSGTTTLARALASRYQTAWVPEYGRTFSEAVGEHHVWASRDFNKILDRQHRDEDELAREAGPVLFCDTDGIATRMFHELYLRSKMERCGLYAEMERYCGRALYILTDDDGVDFQQDGYRLFEAQRRWATNWFQKTLDEFRLPWIMVTGSHDERMNQATAAVDEILKWDFATPVEYRNG